MYYWEHGIVGTPALLSLSNDSMILATKHCIFYESDAPVMYTLWSGLCVRKSEKAKFLIKAVVKNFMLLILVLF